MGSQGWASVTQFQTTVAAALSAEQVLATKQSRDYILVVLLLLLRNLCLYCSNVPWKGFTVPPSTCQSSSTVEEMRCWSWLTINTPPWNVARPCTHQRNCYLTTVHESALVFIPNTHWLVFQHHVTILTCIWFDTLNGQPAAACLLVWVYFTP